MKPNLLRGRILCIAGSDSSGGAGIQADIKAITALGGFAATAITAVTVQNTQGVTAVHAIPLEIIAAQMMAVLDDIGADALKTGMLGTALTIETVTNVIVSHANKVPLIVDPVMIAKGGAALLASDAIGAMQRLLLPIAALVTPNLPEAEALTGIHIQNPSQMLQAAKAFQDLGANAVLIKGGHLPGDDIVDIYVGPEGTREWQSKRIVTRHTHGTGCTLAASIATGIAQHRSMIDAISYARNYVRIAIETAPGLGLGHGPLNHTHTVNRTEGE